MRVLALCRVYTSATCCAQQVACYPQQVACCPHQVACCAQHATCCAQQASSCAQLVARNLLRWCKRGIRDIVPRSSQCRSAVIPHCTVQSMIVADFVLRTGNGFAVCCGGLYYQTTRSGLQRRPLWNHKRRGHALELLGPVFVRRTVVRSMLPTAEFSRRRGMLPLEDRV